MRRRLAMGLAFGIAAAVSGHHIAAQAPQLGFFITSAGPGKGADLGGLAGADAHCQTLAAAAGAGGRTWRAYLSATASGSQPAVNAKDRIGAGRGPTPRVSSSPPASRTCTATPTSCRRRTRSPRRARSSTAAATRRTNTTSSPGLTLDGTASTAAGDSTCGNWTGSGEGSALVGHHDRQGGGANPTSWNFAHPSRGCSQDNLRGTGGDGLFYCFAAK